MTRKSDEQLKLNFNEETEMSELAENSAEPRESASILCFASYIRSRIAREEAALDAQLLEKITTRVQHFK